MSPKTILLAEDDADDQDFFVDVIQPRSDVTLISIVKDGEELFDLLPDLISAGQLPDIILLDHNMPKRNGLQTLQLLKVDEAYKSIPVFVYSTYANDVLLQEFADAGAVYFFAKPVTPDGYNELVDAMMSMVE